MAEEIRIVRGDSVVLKFSTLDDNTGEDLNISQYEAIFSTENFEKTTVNDPSEMQKYVDPDGNHFILVSLNATDTNPSETCSYIQVKLHYQLKLYKIVSPTIFITGSTGILILISE